MGDSSIVRAAAEYSRGGRRRQGVVNALALEPGAVWNAVTAFAWFAFGLVPLQLAVAAQLRLSPERTAGLLCASWLVAACSTLLLAVRTRQPLILNMNIPMFVYLGSLADVLPYEEMLGGIVVAGLVLALLGHLGLGEWLMRWFPLPLAMAMFGGSLFGFVLRAVDVGFVGSPVVAGTLVGFVLAAAARVRMLPPVAGAAIGGAIAAVASGRFVLETLAWEVPILSVVPPALSLAAVASVSIPLIVYTMTAGLRGLGAVATAGFTVPAGSILVGLGVKSVANAVLGAGPAGLGNEVTALFSGPANGPIERRYRAAVALALLMLLLAAAARPMAAILGALPREYLVTLVGVAILPVVVLSLGTAFGGRLKLSAVLTFATAMSAVSALGLTATIWSILVGFVVAALLEPDDLRAYWRDQEGVSQ